MAQLDSNRLRQIFFLSIILGLGLLLFLELYPFINALLGAITFYVLFRNLMFYMVEKRNWNKTLSAGIIIILSFLIILLPTGLMLNVLYNKVSVFLENPDKWLADIKSFVNQLNSTFGIDIMGSIKLDKLPEILANSVPSVLLATLDTMIIVALMYFILYFMLTNARYMEDWIFEYIPLKDNNVEKIEKEVINMVLSNAIGIPLLAIIQAIFAFGAYWALGVPDPILWGLVTAFAAMLPVIGSTAVWFPLSLYLYFNGQEWQALVLWLYGVLVIINVDNLFRMVLQKRMANTHPLITMFGVIIGVNLFGFIGLVFGPLLVSLFIVLLRVYNDEFMTKQRKKNNKLIL